MGDQRFYARRSYHIERFDDHVASLAIDMFDYAGSHESYNQEIINWDMRQSRPFTMADVFNRTQGWKKFVIDYCIAKVNEQVGEDLSLDRDEVGQVVTSQYWRFGTDKAMLYVPFSAVTGLSGPGTDVAIPYKVLKPYLKADAPVL